MGAREVLLPVITAMLLVSSTKRVFLNEMVTHPATGLCRPSGMQERRRRYFNARLNIKSWETLYFAHAGAKKKGRVYAGACDRPLRSMTVLEQVWHISKGVHAQPQQGPAGKDIAQPTTCLRRGILVCTRQVNSRWPCALLQPRIKPYLGIVSLQKHY